MIDRADIAVLMTIAIGAFAVPTIAGLWAGITVVVYRAVTGG